MINLSDASDHEENHLAYTCTHHRMQLAVGDMTMSGWKPTISLIPPPPDHEDEQQYSTTKSQLQHSLPTTSWYTVFI